MPFGVMITPKPCGSWKRFFCERQQVVSEGTSAAGLCVCSEPWRCFCLLQSREVVLSWWNPHHSCSFSPFSDFSVSFKQGGQSVVILTPDKRVWWCIQFVPSLAKLLGFFGFCFFLGVAWWKSCKGLVDEKNLLFLMIPLISFHPGSSIWFE